MQLNDTKSALDINETTEFYENVLEVWPTDDMWHQYSKQMIEKFIKKNQKRLCGTILNAGSGGNIYGLTDKEMTHVDIAANKISMFAKYVVSNIENMSFENCSFDSCICVGSVINYCDAIKAISKISKVLKPNGYLILEYESSYGYEYRFSSAYKKIAQPVYADYQGKKLKQWVYSPYYMKSILADSNLKILKIKLFHIASGLNYSCTKDIIKATSYTKYDSILCYIPPFCLHANNEIYLCKKL